MALTLCLLFLWNGACSEDPEARFKRLDQEAKAHFARSEYDKALMIWEKALTIQPNSADIYQKIGDTHLRVGDYPMAAEAFRQVIHLKPDAWGVRLELAKLQLLSGDIGAAEASWDQLRRGGSNNPEMWIFHGDLMILKDQLNEAELSYRQALAIAPDSDLALIKLAACYFTQGKLAQSEKTYNSVASTEPMSAAVLLQMGDYWKLKGDLEKAEMFLVKAVRIEPENMGLQKILAEFYLDIRQYEKAGAVLHGLLEQRPHNRSVKKLLVEVLLADNRMEAARSTLEELVREGADDLELHLLKGKYHLLALESMQAVGHFEVAVKKEPNLPVAHYLLGLAYLSGAQNHLALRSFIEALRLDPYFSEADLALADLYYKQEEYEFGFEHAGRVCAREPENYRAHLILGNVLLAQRRYDEAMVRFKAASFLDPKAVSPLYYMAMANELSGKTEEALGLYRSLLEKNPKLVDAGMRYANLLIKTGGIERAKRFFEQALSKVT